jgi:hypothetical protein
MKTARAQIIELDYILTGTILKKYGPCGKDGCRCACDEKHWHGPYYIWTRKENGRTVTKSLSASQAQFCNKAISNMQKLKTQIEQWKQESIAVLTNGF